MDGQFIDFKLTKLNIGKNQWISIGFSNNQSKSNIYAIIGVVNQDYSVNLYKRFVIFL